MDETPVQTIVNLIEAWNAHDAQQAAALYAPDYRADDVAYATPLHGQQGGHDMLLRYLQAFPDLHISRDSVLRQGQQVALFWTFRGTHRGAFMGIPPTGRTIAVRGSSLFTVEQGKVRTALHIWDVAGLLRAVGLLPDL